MQNSEYLKRNKYNAAMGLYVDGSAARKIEPEEEKAPAKKTVKVKKTSAQKLRRKKIIYLRRLALKTAAVLVTGTVLTVLCLTMLKGIVRTNALAKEISNLETEYNAIKSQNDSKEYDIDRSVDLNSIIQTATKEYGMVRSSIGQIVTYRADESEYIQRAAQVPQE